jgi:acetyl esterase/lipase
VVLYLHGGAYALCSSQTHRKLCMEIVKCTGATVFCPDYRRPPEHPWPTPVDDSVGAYRWLLEARAIPASRIVVVGDSAGGGLAVALMATARAAGLPMPAGAVLQSPWLDLTDSCSGSWTSMQRCVLPRAMPAIPIHTQRSSARSPPPNHRSLFGRPCGVRCRMYCQYVPGAHRSAGCP